MGLDAQKSFAQMYKYRKVNERIGGQMVALDLITGQEPSEES